MTQKHFITALWSDSNNPKDFTTNMSVTTTTPLPDIKFINYGNQGIAEKSFCFSSIFEHKENITDTWDLWFPGTKI